MDPATLVILVGSALTVGAIVVANQASVAATPEAAPVAPVQRPFTQPLTVSPAPTGYSQSLPAPAPAPAPVYVSPAPAPLFVASAPPAVAPAPPPAPPAPAPASFPTPTPLPVSLISNNGKPFPFTNKTFITTLYNAIMNPTPQNQALIAVQKAATGNDINNFFTSYWTSPTPPAIAVIPASSSPGAATADIQVTLDDMLSMKNLTYSSWTSNHIRLFQTYTAQEGYSPSTSDTITLINKLFTVAFTLASIGI